MYLSERLESRIRTLQKWLQVLKSRTAGEHHWDVIAVNIFLLKEGAQFNGTEFKGRVPNLWC